MFVIINFKNINCLSIVCQALSMENNDKYGRDCFCPLRAHRSVEDTVSNLAITTLHNQGYDWGHTQCYGTR